MGQAVVRWWWGDQVRVWRVRWGLGSGWGSSGKGGGSTEGLVGVGGELLYNLLLD